jgi:hypothetical protein
MFDGHAPSRCVGSFVVYDISSFLLVKTNFHLELLPNET